MEKNAVYLVYTLIEQNDCVSDCHALYATLERAKAVMNVEIEALEPTYSRNIIKLQIINNQTLFGVYSKSKSF